MKVRAHIVVSGRVQGVFFRSRTKQEASVRNVKGWVRNLDDGRVEAVFEGEEEDVGKVIEFCRKGPTNAIVKHVEVKCENYLGNFLDFKIRY